MTNDSFLYLLQLASPALPVGAYSYSEGLEVLVDKEVINNQETLKHWIKQELEYGAIRIETALMLRSYRSVCSNNIKELVAWNSWLSAARETEELRQQSWQMGQSLLKLILDLDPKIELISAKINSPCNYAVAFGIAAASWQIDDQKAVIGYLHSWVSNLITSGIKLIPLGQTMGQQLLFNLRHLLLQVSQEIIDLQDEDLSSCGWGLALASMAHETQYTRLFRS